nr:MAG TPA: tail collar fiber protein [Caudoviricetes sp.]
MKNSLDLTGNVSGFKKAIDNIINANLTNRGLVRYVSAKVVSINDNKTINVYIPPDNSNVISGLINKTGEDLDIGDSVELCTKNGSVKNAWIAVKHGLGVHVGEKIELYYDTLALGSIVLFPGSKLPEGYMFCNGQELNRVTYKELFDVIGTSYGEGDGKTTFNLPNYNGRVPVGLDINDENFDTLGKKMGEKEHLLTVNEMPSHSHTIKTGSRTNVWAEPNFTISYQYQQQETLNTSIPILNTGDSKPHNNIQPSLVSNYIIKVVTTTVLKGNVIDSLEGESIVNAPSIRAVNDKIKKITTPIGIVVGLSSSQSISQGNNTVFFNTVFLTNGEVFSLDSSRHVVDVLEDCFAIISGGVFVDGSQGEGYVWARIKINDNIVTSSLERIINRDFTNSSIPSKFVSLKKGDKISMLVEYTSSSGIISIRSASDTTFLSIVKI